MVVVAQAPYLIGALDPNPLLAVSGLNEPGTHQLLPGNTSIDGNAGITSQANGHRAAIDWLHGHPPWWNPYEGSGNVLAAAAVSGAMFFPFVLLTVIPNGQVALYLALDLIAAGATYALLRRLGARPWACFVAAVLFGLNGTNAWFRFGADNPVAFLPVMVLGVERLRSAVVERRRGGWAVLAIGVAMSLLASFPETAYVDAAVAVAWTAVRCTGLGRAGWRLLRGAAIGAGVGVLIAAPFAVALADDLRIGYLGGHTGSALGNASIVRPGLLSLFSPYALGPVNGFSGPGPSGTTMATLWGNVGGYLTVATLVIALVGLVGRTHRPLRIVLAVVALLLVGRSFGVAFARDIVNLLPGAGSLALYRYDGAGIELPVAVLAGLGVDDLLRRRVPRWAPIASLVVVGGLGGLAAAHDRSLDHLLVGAHVAAWWRAALGWAAVSGVAVGVAALVRGKVATTLLVVVLTVDAVGMFAIPELSAPRGVKVDTAAVRFLQPRIGTSRFMSFGGFAPNYGAYYGVASANVSDLPIPQSTATYETTQLAPDALPIGFDGVTQAQPGPTPRQELPAHLDSYRRLGVAFILEPPGQGVGDLPPGAVTEVYQDPMVDIYRLNGSQPYATASPGCTVSTRSRTTIVTDCSRPGELLRRETMVPGWTARAGDHPATLRASADGFQLTSVPAGRTVVRYSFAPPHEQLATLAFLAGLLLLAWGAWLAIPRRRPRLT